MKPTPKDEKLVDLLEYNTYLFELLLGINEEYKKVDPDSISDSAWDKHSKLIREFFKEVVEAIRYYEKK